MKKCGNYETHTTDTEVTQKEKARKKNRKLLLFRFFCVVLLVFDCSFINISTLLFVIFLFFVRLFFSCLNVYHAHTYIMIRFYEHMNFLFYSFILLIFFCRLISNVFLLNFLYSLLQLLLYLFVLHTFFSFS